MSNGENGHGFWPTWKSNKLFTVLLTVLIAYALVWLGTLVQLNLGKFQRLGKAEELPHAITIEGTGKVTGTPDVAIAELGLQVEATDVPTAQRENTAKMNAFIEALKGLGIATKDIQTSQYSINPRYRYDREAQRSVIDGYTVRQSIQVKIRDLNKISTVLGKAGELGLNDVGGLRFSIDDPDKLREEARGKALAQAREKARDIATSLNVRLGRVVGFDESAGSSGPPVITSYYEGGGGGLGPIAPQVESGSLDVAVTVNVTYEIE